MAALSPQKLRQLVLEERMVKGARGSFVRKYWVRAQEERAERRTKEERPLQRSSKRVWQGKSVPLRKEQIPGKAVTGQIGENLAIKFLKESGFPKAAALHTAASQNLPLDLVADHHLVEVKTGVVSSTTRRWRATIGEPGVKEKAWLKKARSGDKAEWNKRKVEMALIRKQKFVTNYSQKLGRDFKPATVGIIIDPRTRTADVHMFDGFHASISWTSEQAAKGYVGTFRYGK